VRLEKLHDWDVSPGEAITFQNELAQRVISRGHPDDVRLIAAADVAYVERAPAWAASTARAAVVVVQYPACDIVEQSVVEYPVRFPYVPGLLSFRELPAIAAAFEEIRSAPDLLLVDGHGYAHPRRFGFACHVGVLAGRPTIGCAKSRLCGEMSEPGAERGERSLLIRNDEPVGVVLRTKRSARPVYVSTGHMISMEAAAEWILRLAPTHRLPAPLRLADMLSKGHSIGRSG
jgi:deoxyribonuclease V